jgi:hypothetical protein
MQVFDKIVHIPKITRITAIPLANADLLQAIVVFGSHACVVRRRRNGAVCIFGYLAKVLYRRDGQGRWFRGNRCIEARAFAGSSGGLVVGRMLETEAAPFDVLREVVRGIVR